MIRSCLSLFAIAALVGCIDGTLVTDVPGDEDDNSAATYAADVRADEAAAAPRIVLSVPSLTLDEGGRASISVQLSSAPASTVVVSIIRPRQLWRDVGELVFTPASWNLPQGVTFEALHDDNVVDGLETVFFWSPAMEARLPTLIIDDDEVGVVLTAPEVVAEGAVVGATVRLSHQPVSNVPVTLTSSDPSRLLLSTTQAVFTPTNWWQPQTVIAHSLIDADENADEVVVTATVPMASAQRIIAIEDTTTRVTVGWPQLLPENIHLFQQYVHAVRVTAYQPFVLDQYQVFAAGQTRVSIGLYDGNAMPTHLRSGSVVTFDLSSPSSGAPTAVPLSTPLHLPAGVYWLAIVSDHGIDVRSANVSPAAQRCTQPSNGVALPAQWLFVPVCGGGRALSLSGAGAPY